MWPFSAMEYGSAVRWSDVANAVLLLSLIAGVVATFVIVQTNNIKESHWDRERVRSTERSARLEKETAEAKAREAEAMVKLEEVRKYAAPRMLDPNFEKDIADIPKIPVEIWYMQEASDAQSFAYMIWESFRMVNWPAIQPIPIPEPDKSNPRLQNMTRTGAAGGGPSGVSIVIPSDAHRQPSGEPLMNALGKNNEYGAWISVNPAMPLPDGMFRIVVSAKPDPRLEYTPTTRPARK